jgi:hypothetical protein
MSLFRLVEQGHQVVGVDASEVAILRFFDRRGLDHEVKPLERIENGKIYTVRQKHGHNCLGRCNCTCLSVCLSSQVCNTTLFTVM